MAGVGPCAEGQLPGATSNFQSRPLTEPREGQLQGAPCGARAPPHGGELKVIAAVLEAPVIERTLTHLRLQARAPPRARAAVRGQMERL